MNQSHIRSVTLTFGRLFDALDQVAGDARDIAHISDGEIAHLHMKVEICEEIKKALIRGIEKEIGEPVNHLFYDNEKRKQ